MKKWFSLFLAVVFTFSLAACGQEGQNSGPSPTPSTNGAGQNSDNDSSTNQTYTFVYANSNDTNAFAMRVRNGFESAAEEYGVDLICLDNKQDAIQANANADQAITQDVDFYFQYNTDEEVNNLIGQKLYENGIKAIAIQVPMGIGDSEDSYPFYGVSNYGSGFTCGEALAEAAIDKWGSSENYLMFSMGFPEAGALFQDRAAGAIDGVKSLIPDIEVVESSSDDDVDTARQRTADFLVANPEGKILIWSHADMITLGVIAAVRAADRTDDVLIVSNAADPTIATELSDPNSIVVGTIEFDPESWGAELIPLAIKWIEEGVEPDANMAPTHVLVTAANMDQYFD